MKRLLYINRTFVKGRFKVKDNAKKEIPARMDR